MRVAISRICRGKTERCEVGTWLLATALQLTKQGIYFYDFVADKLGVEVARNWSVQEARRHECDVLFMVDADMVPNRAFAKRALAFLKANPGSVIGSPYMHHQSNSAGGWQVFTASPREDGSAVRCKPGKGVEQVAAVGTGLCAIDLKAFDKLTPPYFRQFFGESNVYHEQQDGTEDVYCFVRMTMAGVKVCADWDCRSGHNKSITLGEPT
jgi:hypothetical protein